MHTFVHTQIPYNRENNLDRHHASACPKLLLLLTAQWTVCSAYMMSTENLMHSVMGPRNNKKRATTSKHEWTDFEERAELVSLPIKDCMHTSSLSSRREISLITVLAHPPGNSHAHWNYKIYHTVIHTEAALLVLIPPRHTAQSRKSCKAENSPWQVGSWCWRRSLGRSSRLWRFMVAGNSAHPIPNAHVVQLPGWSTQKTLMTHTCTTIKVNFINSSAKFLPRTSFIEKITTKS